MRFDSYDILSPSCNTSLMGRSESVMNLNSNNDMSNGVELKVKKTKPDTSDGGTQPKTYGGIGKSCLINIIWDLLAGVILYYYY